MIEKDLRQELVNTTTTLYQAGIITDKGGNISVRSLEHKDALWITPSQINKGSLEADQMVLIGFDGKKIEGEGRPSIESSYHGGLMAARNDVNAVVHSHAPNATVFGVTDMEIPPFIPEAVFIMDFPRISFFLGGSKDLAKAVLEQLGEGKAGGAFLCNHGLVTVGKSLGKAAERSLMVEQTLGMLFTLKMLGEKPNLMPENAVKLLSQFSGLI